MTVETQPLITVIVPVWNDPVRIVKCVEALKAQTIAPHLYRIIVVDNGSTDSTLDVIRSLGVDHMIETRPGSYAARNLAINSSSSRLLAFTDADCVPARDWLEKALAAADANPGFGVLAGRITLFDEDGGGNDWIKRYEAILSFPQHQAALGNCATANWMSPRQVIEDMGLFDASVKSGGDKQMGLKVKAAGLPLIYVPDMIVEHPVRARADELVNKRQRLSGGHWDRLPPKDRLRRALTQNAVETRRRAMRILRSREFSWADRLRAEAVLIWLAWVDLKEYVRLARGGSVVR